MPSEPTDVEYSILSVLSRHGSVSVDRLASSLSLGLGVLQERLQDMGADGLIEFVIDRDVHVRMTRTGLAAHVGRCEVARHERAAVIAAPALTS